jgi:predicted permease
MAPLLTGGSRELDDRNLRGYSIIGRLQPGVQLADAQAQVDRAMADLARAHPETNASIGGEVDSFWNAVRGPQRFFASALTVLQGIMLLLLLAVCGNVASLLLARASTRQREIGIRLAIGGPRWQVGRLLLFEGGILAAAGTALGLAIAAWATQAARAVPMIGAFPIRFQTHINAAGLGVAALLGLLAGVLVGAGPAWYLSRLLPTRALRAGQQTAARHPLRQVLMAAQVALATVVLVIAALFLRSLEVTRDIDPGFRREGVLLAAYDFSDDPDANGRARPFAADLLARLSVLPSVEAAAIATSVPLDIHGMPLRTFTVEGRARTDGGSDQSLLDVVTPGYFAVMGIPLVEGQDFAGLNDTAAPPQAIVNEEFVRRFVDGEPIGRRLGVRGRTYVVTGVVRNSLSESFDERPTPVFYLSYRDRPAMSGEIHVRTRAGGETLVAPEIQRVVRDLDPALPLYDVRTLTEHVEKNLFLRRIPARMFAVLGPLLLILAAIGIYAVVDFTVSRRTTEIGVRIALGATVARVVRQIVGESLTVIAIGAMVGWLAMFLVALHLLRGVISLPVFAGIPALLVGVGALACWVPARRAARLDPIAALREE